MTAATATSNGHREALVLEVPSRHAKEVQAAADRALALAAYRESAAAGTPMTGAQLGALVGRTDRWGRSVIAATREAEVAATPRAEASADDRDRWIAYVVLAVAAVASYGHMHGVALTAGEVPWIAALWPLTVDGLALAAIRRGGRQGVPWLLLAAAVSIACNVAASSGPEVVQDRAWTVFAWPPIAAFGAERLTRRARSERDHGG